MDKCWPDDGGTVGFSDLCGPVCDAIRFSHSLRRVNVGLDIPWGGFNIGSSELATCFSPSAQLSAEMLASDADQGRDVLDVCVGIAVQLGIEQGRRIGVEKGKLSGLMGEIEVDNLRREVDSLKRKLKKVRKVVGRILNDRGSGDVCGISLADEIGGIVGG